MNKKHLSVALLIFLSSLIFLSFGIKKTNSNKSNPIVLITLESVRADHLPCYGYGRNTTPNICKIAKDGVLFKNAYSGGINTHTSVPVIFSGDSPLSVGLPSFKYEMSDKVDTIAERLKDRGYRTIRTGRFPPLATSNIVQGFEEVKKQKEINFTDNLFYWRYFPKLAHFPFAPSKEYRTWDNVSLNKRELKRLCSEKGCPEQREILEELGSESVKTLYDEEILEADSEIGNLIEKLKNKNLYKESMIVITSDHGEYFGEHGHWRHGGPPYKEVTRVPLIVKFPENRWKGKIIESSSGHIHIAPTVYDVLNIRKEKFKTKPESLVSIINYDSSTGVYSSGYEILNEGVLRNDGYQYFLLNCNQYCLNKSTPKERMSTINGNNKSIINSKIKKRFRKDICKKYLKNIENRYIKLKNDLNETVKKRLKNLGYLN